MLDYSEGKYFTTSELCQTVIDLNFGRLSWSKEGHGGTLTSDMFWRDVSSVPLVVLDEIGSRDRVTDHHYDAVKRVLDERMNRPLVLISNLSLEEVERLYDDRIASRMGAGTVMNVQGKDRRIARA